MAVSTNLGTPAYYYNPWKELEEERRRSAMADMLEKMQEEHFKKQELERGIQEEQKKQMELRTNALAQALGGTMPTPGGDVGQFSAGGAPMQWGQVGPGTGGFKGLSQVPQATDETREMLKRSLLYPHARGPRELEYPSEVQQRATQHELDMLNRQKAVLQDLEMGREKRQETREKGMAERGAAERSKAERIATQREYATALREAQRQYADQMRQLEKSYNIALNDPMTRKLIGNEQLQKEFLDARRRIYEQVDEQIQGIHETFGAAGQRSSAEVQARRAFAEIPLSKLRMYQVESFDQLAAAAEAAGMSVEEAVARLRSAPGGENAKSK